MEKDNAPLILANQLCDMHASIRDVEADLKESIHAVSIAMGAEFCATNKNVSDNAHRLDKSILEGRQIICEKIDRETDCIKSEVRQFERQTAENFCSLRTELKDSERRIIDRLTADKLDEKKEIIDELRHGIRYRDQQLLIGNQLNDLKVMMNSIEQNQRFSSKTVQFGTGNVSTPTQTANQG